MKNKFAILAVAAALVFSAQVWAKTVLPDACGDEKVKFDVDLK